MNSKSSHFTYIFGILVFFCIGVQSPFCAVIQQNMVLSVMVKGDDLLSQQVKVSADGTIDYPLYQDTPVLGMTTSELQDILTIKLANYTDAPFVLVTIIPEMPIDVHLLGQVIKPGPLKVSPKTSLQEVLQMAGGTTEFADITRIKIVHKNQTDEDASYYNFQEFLVTGNIATLPILTQGDRIVVLTASKMNKIKVLGAVNKPGYYSPLDSTTIFDLLYLAGGPGKEANLSKIRVLGHEGKRETDVVLNLEEYIDDGKLNEVPLASPGDVIIVYHKSFTWGKILTGVRDIVTLVTAWFVVSQVFK